MPLLSLQLSRLNILLAFPHRTDGLLHSLPILLHYTWVERDGSAPASPVPSVKGFLSHVLPTFSTSLNRAVLGPPQ